MVSPGSFSAVLLAGGRSTRMGRDKALLDVSGQPLWRRQAELLRETGAVEIFFSVRPDQAWLPADATRVIDAAPDSGPLGGLAAALKRSESPYLLVLAVDLPLMRLDFLRRLLGQRKPAKGVVPTLNGQYEPLVAVYPREIADFVARALAQRKLSLQSLVGEAIDGGLMEGLGVEAAEADLFTNWNSVSDFAPPAA
ncbi:MAG TPA: molybdenum cofactor guanylyltransferase [Opitutaceae bacterium]|nr:molybdenum cofactor guanylyltransferase [Opitutaceae bacterium]